MEPAIVRRDDELERQHHHFPLVAAVVPEPVEGPGATVVGAPARVGEHHHASNASDSIPSAGTNWWSGVPPRAGGWLRAGDSWCACQLWPHQHGGGAMDRCGVISMSAPFVWLGSMIVIALSNEVKPSIGKGMQSR